MKYPAAAGVRSGSLALVLMLLTALTACDTVTPPATLFLEEGMEADFRFEFSGDQFGSGEVRVVSTGGASLTAALRDNGFTAAEVISARVVSAELERVSPLGVDLSFLDQVDVGLTTSNQSAPVARSTALPGSATADLQVISGADVAAFVRASSFRAALEFVPAATAPAENYVLTVSLRFRVEVEGL